MYFALIFLVILTWDVWKALWFEDPATGQASFGMGVGTLVLSMNVFLLGSYTLGCHSLRHLVGGRLKVLSKRPVRSKAHSCVTCLNKRHMLFAWWSLFWVGFSDFYVRMLAMGVWVDWRLF